MAKKAVQIRVPATLAADINFVAAGLGMSQTEYVEKELSASISRDLPKVAKIAQERADAAKPPKK